MSPTAISRPSLSALRKKLHRENPICHWCGIPTIMLKPKDGIVHPWDMATVDHIKPRRECRTVQEWKDPTNAVNSCNACNQRRDIVDGSAFVSWLLGFVPRSQWWRAKHFIRAAREFWKGVTRRRYLHP